MENKNENLRCVYMKKDSTVENHNTHKGAANNQAISRSNKQCKSNDDLCGDVDNSKVKGKDKCSSKHHSPNGLSRSPPKSSLDKSKLPPLKGLLKGDNKTLSKERWQEIERSNLLQVSTMGRNNEFYICDTDVGDVRKSLRHSMLEVSRKNMENIAFVRPRRKFLILRSEIRRWKTSAIIGIALVNTLAGLSKGMKEGYYFANVTYLCLSISSFPGNILGSCRYDGAEVPPHISNNFIQLYMLALRQKKVEPLFPYIYPWNSQIDCGEGEAVSCLSQRGSGDKTETCESTCIIKSNIDCSDFYSDETIGNSSIYGEELSFKQINDDLSYLPDTKECFSLASRECMKGVTKEMSEIYLRNNSSGYCSLGRSRGYLMPSQHNAFFNISRNSGRGILGEKPVDKVRRVLGRGTMLAMRGRVSAVTTLPSPETF